MLTTRELCRGRFAMAVPLGNFCVLCFSGLVLFFRDEFG